MVLHYLIVRYKILCNKVFNFSLRQSEEQVGRMGRQNKTADWDSRTRGQNGAVEQDGRMGWQNVMAERDGRTGWQNGKAERDGRMGGPNRTAKKDGKMRNGSNWDSLYSYCYQSYQS